MTSRDRDRMRGGDRGRRSGRGWPGERQWRDEAGGYRERGRPAGDEIENERRYTAADNDDRTVDRQGGLGAMEDDDRELEMREQSGYDRPYGYGYSWEMGDERGYRSQGGMGMRGGYGRRGRYEDQDQGWRGYGRQGGSGGYSYQGAMGEYGQQGGAGSYGQRGVYGGERGPHTGKGPKGYQRSDERIREDVCEALSQHGYIDASDIDVSVQNGEVMLEGTIDSRETKRRAEEWIENLSGVREVHNRLRVTDIAR